MILIIDNYDSFTYNLYQLIAMITEEEVSIIRNDVISLDEIKLLSPKGIILSPGPGEPKDSKICLSIIKDLAKDIPLLGVCLGHQAIAISCGGTVDKAKRPVHGKSKLVMHENNNIFRGIASPFTAGCYNSLAVKSENFPECLIIDALDLDGEIMALSHLTYPMYGVQFHPESILTDVGLQIIKNFLEICNVKTIH